MEFISMLTGKNIFDVDFFSSNILISLESKRDILLINNDLFLFNNAKRALLLRNEEFKAEGNLTYNGCNVNEGDAMNVTTGIFTAPRKGIYQLTFHANTV